MFDRQICVPMTDDSQIGEARRHATRMAKEADLDETLCGGLAIIVTELATNLVRHAQGGEVLLRPLGGAERGVEILSIDRGPGMPDIARCLEDGYSTGGTSGTGLGAVRRLSTNFDIISTQPAGTVVMARLLDRKRGATLNPWSAVSRPALHESVCGDAWRIAERSDVIVVMMVDGLGHGPEAAKAAELAVAAFEQDPFAPLVEIVKRIDRLMRGSRGGAVAIARVEISNRLVKFVGVGNIAARLKSCDDQPARGLVSHNGTAGVQMLRVHEFDYSLAPQSLLIMHSDGLQSRWSLDNYAGWSGHHPAVLAGVLYRDHMRGRDDVTVAAVRVNLAA